MGWLVCDLVLQGRDVITCNIADGPLDGAKASDEGEAQRREYGPATILATDLTRGDGLAEDLVDFLYQIPGTAIGHAHGTAGRRDRTERSDVLEKLDFSGANAAFRVKIYAQAQGRHGVSPAFVFRLSGSLQDIVAS